MARSYGQIVAAIWRDPDFRKLPQGAQWAYIMLATQGDISSCGLLSITVGRWASYASDLTRDALSDALSVLVENRFLVVDWDSEELLVRSFTKWDGGSTNSKRRPAILAAAHGVASPVIRGVLAREFDKLGLTHSLSDSPSHRASDSPSDEAPDRPRFVVNSTTSATGNLNPEPETTTHNPEPETGTLAQAAPTTTAQTLVGEWVDRCKARPPGQVVGNVAKLVGQMLSEGIDPDDIRRGLSAWMTKGLHPSTLPSVVNEVMNAPNAGRPTRRRDTDDKVRDGLALAQRLLAGQEEPTITGQPRQIGA